MSKFKSLSPEQARTICLKNRAPNPNLDVASQGPLYLINRTRESLAKHSRRPTQTENTLSVVQWHLNPNNIRPPKVLIYLTALIQKSGWV